MASIVYKVGGVYNGYRYRGGGAGAAANWEPAQSNAYQALIPQDDAPQEAPTGLVARAKDTGIDLLHGAVDLGQGAVGLASMATGGLAGKGMRSIGYDPEATHAILNEGYSKARSESEAEVAGAEGFIGKAGALIENPDALVGRVVRTTPSMLGLVAGARTAATRAYGTVKEAHLAAGATEAEAIRAASSAAQKVAANWSAGLEGAQQAGTSFQQQQDDGIDLGANYLTSAGSGATTALFSKASGAILPDVEASIATRGMGQVDMLGGGLVKRVGQGIVKEGALEEMPQSATEQLWGNLAYDRPAFEGVPESAAEGLVVGGAAGGGFNAIAGRQNNDDAERLRQQADIAAAQQRESQSIMQAERDALDAANAEEAARVEAERTRDRRMAAAKQYPFEQFEPMFKDEVAQRKAEEKALTEQAKQLYGEHVAAADPTQPLPDLKTFTKQHLADNGVTGEKLDIRQEYVNFLDEMADRDEQATAEGLSRTDYTQPDGSGQMSFLDEVSREGDSVLSFDPNLRGDIVDNEVTRFENEQGGVNGYRGQLIDEPGSFENVVPRRDFGLSQPVNGTGSTQATIIPVAQKPAKSAPRTPAAPLTTAGPIAAARVAAVENGVSPGAWARFVSKNELVDADTETIAEALRNRAINGMAGYTDAWEAAHKAMTGETIEEFLTRKETDEKASIQAEQTQIAERQSAGRQTLPAVQETQVGALTPAGLSSGQQAVYDTMMAASQNNEFDKFQQSDGKLNYTAIAEASGLKGKQAAYAAVKQTVDKVAEQLGTTRDGMKDFLRQRTAQVRTTEASEADMLGTSPDNFTKTSLQPGAQLDNGDLFGNDEGATAGFGVIDSTGGSQSAVGENVQPTETDLAKPDPVAEKRAAEAMARYAAVQTEALAQPEAAEAAADWNDMRADMAPFAKDLSRQDAYDWLMTYMEWKNGDITEDQLAAEQLDIERRYEADPANAAGKRDGAVADGQGEQRALAEGKTPAGETAGSQTEGTETERGQADPEVTLNPIEARVAELRKHVGEVQGKRLDKLIERYADGDIDLERLGDELQMLEEQAFPPEQGGKGVMFSRETIAGSSREKLNSAIEQWAGVVDAYLGKTLDPTKTYTLFPSTPASMQVLGLPDLPVTVGKHALSYANIRLTSQEMKALPEAMADPQLVYLHEGGNGELSLNFVLDSGGYNGVNVVAVQPNKTGEGERRAHYVATILNVRPESIAREVREGRGMYQGNVNAPAIKAAFQEAKTRNGRQSAGLRELMSRNFGLPTTLPRVMYRTDLVKLVDDGRARFSEANEPESNGQDAATLREKMRKLFVNPALLDKRVTVVQSEADLPAKHREDAADSRMQTVRGGLYETNTGKVYLIADNIPPGREFSVFMHEVGGHMGMRNLLGKVNFDALYGQINTWAEGDGAVENEVAKAALDRVMNAGVTTEGEVKEELIAYFVEEAVRRGIDPTAVRKIPRGMQQWFHALWNAVKSAVQKLGLNPATLTAQDIVDLAYGAARLELNGSQTDIDAAADAAGRPATDVAFVEPKADVAPVMNSVTMTTARRETKQMIDELPDHLREPAHWINTKFRELGNAGLRISMFTQDLVDSVESVLPSARDWFESINKRETIRIGHEAEVDDIASRHIDALSQSQFNRTWKLLHDMTRSQKWAYVPTWKSTAVADPEMAARYDALDAAEKAALDAVLKHGNDTLTEVNSVLDQIANDLFDAKVNRATSEASKKKLADDKARYLRMYGRKLMLPQGPYAPMRRVGSHIAVGKSQLYLDTEALAKTGNAKAIDTLSEIRTQDQHFMVSFHDGKYEAERQAREYEAAGMTATASAKEVFTSGDQLPFQAFQSLREMANQKDGQHAVRLMNMIDELYLTSLSDVSARKSELRREGVGGLNPDTMYRAFLSKGKANAHYLAVLKTHRDVAGKFSAMRSEANASSGTRGDKMDAFNELKKRYEASFDYQPSPLVSKLMNISTYWMLLTKPAYYLYNLTQPFMMTLPYITKRHDYMGAANHLVRAYSDLLKTGKVMTLEHFNLDALPADIRDAMKQLRDMGRLDITITQDLGNRIHAGQGSVSKYTARMDNFFRTLAQKTEMANRVVTAATAYRLHLEKTPGDAAGALAYAADVVDKTQGNYSNFNAPRLFNMNSTAKLMTQFKKFQLIQATLLITTVKGIANPHERAASMRALKFMLGHHALLAGAMGMPAINLIAMAFVAAGDDDEPRDLELWMKKNMGDDALGQVLRYGVPALFNVNMSANVGMGQTFSVIPYADVDATRSGYDSMVTSLMGPTIGGLGPQLWGAAGKGIDGDYYGMLAGLLPGFLKSSMKAMGEAVDGTRTGAGDVLVTAEDIAFTDTLLKSVGLRTMKDTTRQLITEKRYEFEGFFRDSVKDIKKKYNEAYRDGDGAEMAALRDRWIKLQQFKREYGFKAQPLSQLMKSPMEQAKRERMTAGGVQFNAGNEGFVTDLVDDAEE